MNSNISTYFLDISQKEPTTTKDSLSNTRKLYITTELIARTSIATFSTS